MKRLLSSLAALVAVGLVSVAPAGAQDLGYDYLGDYGYYGDYNVGYNTDTWENNDWFYDYYDYGEYNPASGFEDYDADTDLFDWEEDGLF